MIQRIDQGAWLLFLSMITCSLSINGCKTTNENETAPTVADEFTTESTISSEQGKFLYASMLEKEVSLGLNDKSESVHVSNGVLLCKRFKSGDESVRCELQARLTDEQLSTPSVVKKELAEQANRFISSTRKDLEDEHFVAADVRCEYVGKKNPPFVVEDMNCKFRHPRRVSETVFSGKSASDMRQALETATTQPAPRRLDGSVVCQWMMAKSRAACVVRSAGLGASVETFKQLDHEVSTQIARSLLRTKSDLEQGEGKTQKKAPSESGEISAALTCVQDPPGNAQRTVCRGRL